MSAATVVSQVVNILGLTAIVVLAVLFGHWWRDLRPVLRFPLLWGLFGVVYYVLVLGGHLSPPAVLLWGAMHRTVAVIMVLNGMLALYAVRKRRENAD